MNENEELTKEIGTLKDKMWNTSRIRIKTAERLISNANFLENMSAYYSISLAMFSIVSLLYGNKLFDLINVLLSVALLGIVYYGNSINFRERYNKMKDNYLSIERAYYNLLAKEKTINFEDLSGIYDDYNNILNKVENHILYDYLAHLIDENKKHTKEENDKDKKMKFLELNLRKYKFNKIVGFLLKSIVVIIPVIVGVYSIIIIANNK